MKIPQRLPQFENEPTLIVVTGGRTGTVWSVEDGVIERLETYQTPIVSYSDNEGQFMQRGRDGVYAVGSVREPHHELVRARHVLTLVAGIRRAAKDMAFEAIVVCAPTYLLPPLLRRLPYTLHDKVRATIPANLVGTHPIALLERIAKRLYPETRPAWHPTRY